MDKIVPHEYMGFNEPIPNCPKDCQQPHTLKRGGLFRNK